MTSDCAHCAQLATQKAGPKAGLEAKVASDKATATNHEPPLPAFGGPDYNWRDLPESNLRQDFLATHARNEEHLALAIKKLQEAPSRATI